MPRKEGGFVIGGQTDQCRFYFEVDGSGNVLAHEVGPPRPPEPIPADFDVEQERKRRSCCDPPVEVKK